MEENGPWPTQAKRGFARSRGWFCNGPCSWTGAAFVPYLLRSFSIRIQPCPDVSANLSGPGRVPHVRLSVHGPKMDSSNAFTPWAKVLDLDRILLPIRQKTLKGAAPHLFRPMYAGGEHGAPVQRARLRSLSHKYLRRAIFCRFDQPGTRQHPVRGNLTCLGILARLFIAP